MFNNQILNDITENKKMYYCIAGLMVCCYHGYLLYWYICIYDISNKCKPSA